MKGLPVDLLALTGCVLAVLAAVAAYRVGFAAGSTRAHRLWAEWTGISPAELESHQFDKELRHLRRNIGRPVDPWPDQDRED